MSPVTALGVEPELMGIDHEGTRTVRPLMQLGHNVATHLEQRGRRIAGEIERHVVFPLDLVAHVVGR